MSRIPKVVAWFALVTGALTLAWWIMLFFVPHQPISRFAIANVLMLGSLSVVGGYFGLKAKPWAF